MFKDMPQAVAVTQGHLRALEGWRRVRGAGAGRLLRQVMPETGHLLAILLAGCPQGPAVEAGTGMGYSALWLALACRVGRPPRRLFTFETDPGKAEVARQSLSAAKVGDVVELREAEALAGMAALPGFSFCFLDAGVEVALAGLPAALGRLPSGGVVCVAGVVEEAEAFAPVLTIAEEDERADSVVIPLGTGLLVCRRK